MTVVFHSVSPILLLPVIKSYISPEINIHFIGSRSPVLRERNHKNFQAEELAISKRCP